MKCLSVRQPWAWAIMRAGKDVENRSWPTSVRGRVAIHAGKSVDWAAITDLRMDGIPIPQGTLPAGCIVGTVEIVDCVKGHPSMWADEDPTSFQFVLRDPQPLPEPIPCKGQLGFFEVEI